MISYSNNEYTARNTRYVEAVGSANFGCTAYTVHASAIASELALLSASAQFGLRPHILGRLGNRK